MLRREQCEFKTLVTHTNKTPMDKGTQPGVKGVKGLKTPACVCVCVRDANAYVRIHKSKSDAFACRSLKTIHTLHREKKPNGVNKLFGKGHSVKEFTVFTPTNLGEPC